MTKSQDLKFNAIENTDAIVGIDIAKNVHWAGIILPNGKEIKKSFSFHNNKKGFESLVEIVKNVLTMCRFVKHMSHFIDKSSVSYTKYDMLALQCLKFLIFLIWTFPS